MMMRAMPDADYAVRAPHLSSRNRQGAPLATLFVRRKTLTGYLISRSVNG